ncbi:uncharacterized protein LOC135154201 [Lytechinus pictus]|uniref:uncharacterized protein LOC135154201 n=1 Tax=Lytechinus pictus TaxID=7653 RepID=UPI0030B9C69C
MADSRKSSRERQPTEKMAALQASEESKTERKFFKMYGSLKATVKAARTIIKTETEEGPIKQQISILEAGERELMETYEILRRHKVPIREATTRMDRANAMVRDSLNALEEVLGSLEGPFDAEDRKQIAKEFLKQEYASSVFSSILSEMDQGVETSQLRGATPVIDIDSNPGQPVESRNTPSLLPQDKMYPGVGVNQPPEGIQGQSAEFPAKTSSPSFQDEMGPEFRVGQLHDSLPDSHVEPRDKTPLQPPQTTSVDVQGLCKALADNMYHTRLPMPVPRTFSGDPLEFVEFDKGFKTLIENRGIPPTEMLYYLKQYLTGPAREAVEGFFFGDSKEAYDGAWRCLRQRYGHPFNIQQAFRKKLSAWPKIASKDAIGLQKFADYLKSCDDAMPYVTGLQVLNDCYENQKMIAKLPDWLISSWNRVVSNELEGGSYPSFSKFVKFVAKEARIANNPISSLGALKSDDSQRESSPKTFKIKREARNKGSALAVNTKESAKGKNIPNQVKKAPKPCCLCSETGHKSEDCDKFLAKPLSERRKFVQENHVCFGCLQKGHFSKACKQRLKCSTCGKRHPTALHEENPTIREDNAHKSEGASKDRATSCQVRSGKQASTSMIVPVWVAAEQAPSSEILTYALLDTQSDSSFILDEVAQALNAKQQPIRLKLSTMTSSSNIDCSVTSSILVRGMMSPSQLKIGKCYTRDFIPTDREHIPSRSTAEKWTHLQDVAREMPALQRCEVGLLIGYNCPRALTPRQVVTGSDVEPFAVRTDLGWSIVGFAEEENAMDFSSQCGRVSTREIPFPKPKEIIGLLEADFAEDKSPDKACSQNDLQFLKHLETNIVQCEDGHLQMPLPFKTRPNLPSNKRLATVRFEHLHRKLKKDEAYRDNYTSFMTDIINGGFAEQVETKAPPGETNYIPHHGVYHPIKKKMRIVFDCSAKYGGTCLNDHLLKGPDMINSLVGVLCRFRKHNVAVLCDVEKMFFQFRVAEDDRDLLRFLWFQDNDINKEPVDYRMNVHLFGAASSPGCANYGLKYLARHCSNEFPLASRFVERSFYVDDGLVSVSSEEEAIQLANEARQLCSKGGLRLHKFVSNSKAVLESLPKSERASDVTDSNLDFEDQVERALGIVWNVATDAFCLRISLKEKPMTRRGILSIVASLYDPLGFVAPVVLDGKRILQEMCRSGLGWDDPVSENLQSRWEQWCKEIPQLEELRIPRCYHPAEFGDPVTVQLHHFSDASKSGYGQCSYLRLVNQKGEVHCCLIFGKSRVAPTKVVTIPRLELTAAVVSAKVHSMLKEELEYHDAEDFFWTDSQVVLGYIHNDARRFHTFVANRVQLIRDRTSPDQWHYVSTDQNPADHASRGLSVSQLGSTNWFQGPSFLWEKDFAVGSISPTLAVGDPEVRATNLSTTTHSEPLNLLSRLTRISSWKMMIKVLARLRMVVKGARQGSLVRERKDAELFVLRLVQQEAYPEEIKALTSDKTVKTTSTIHDLDPIILDGITRVKGRLGELSTEVAHPVILPKRSPITRAIIRHFHEDIKHQGRGMTQNHLRANGFWIVNGSKVVAEVLRKCVSCRRLRRPQEEQKMANLPRDRVEPSAPFTNVGMDCFGPFFVRRGRSDIKRYGLIFTCLCSRGIHIEMLDDMTTDAFINALRCFIAIRGAVRQIRCDQGSNFVGARNELQSALREMTSDQVNTYLADQQCEFVFNAPHSSHAGGVWERQIRTVRSVLRATIDLCPGRLTDSALRTLFYEAMAIVNSRPLTVTNMNDPSADAPLTPNHLLTLKRTVPLPPPGQFVKEDVYTRKAWRRVQFLLEQFWSRWRKEYLLGLQRRQKWTMPRRNLQVGDIVLLTDDEAPRMKWPIAMVAEATPDEDGLVRRVQVRVGTKDLDNKGRPNKKLAEYWRPVQKLVLLLEKVPP